MSTPETLRWWAEQFRTRTKEFYTSHVLVADLNYAADEIESLERENAKLREFAARMARALNITSMCYDPDWCESGCAAEFKCRVPEDGGETSCPTWARLVELGVVK